MDDFMIGGVPQRHPLSVSTEYLDLELIDLENKKAGAYQQSKPSLTDRLVMKRSAQASDATQGILPILDFDRENNLHSKNIRTQPYGNHFNNIEPHKRSSYTSLYYPSERMYGNKSSAVSPTSFSSLNKDNFVTSYEGQLSSSFYYNRGFRQNALDLENLA